jgi:hypothetical protein
MILAEIRKCIWSISTPQMVENLVVANEYIVVNLHKAKYALLT